VSGGMPQCHASTTLTGLDFQFFCDNTVAYKGAVLSNCERINII